MANVKALVYRAAFSLAAGETVARVLPPHKYPGSHIGPTKMNVVPVTNLAHGCGQDVALYIKSPHFRDIFAGDVSPQRSALGAAMHRPLANYAVTEPSGTRRSS
jgi:hypothetical protein